MNKRQEGALRRFAEASAFIQEHWHVLPPEAYVHGYRLRAAVALLAAPPEATAPAPVATVFEARAELRRSVQCVLEAAERALPTPQAAAIVLLWPETTKARRLVPAARQIAERGALIRDVLCRCWLRADFVEDLHARIRNVERALRAARAAKRRVGRRPSTRIAKYAIEEGWSAVRRLDEILWPLMREDAELATARLAAMREAEPEATGDVRGRAAAA